MERDYITAGKAIGIAGIVIAAIPSLFALNNARNYLVKAEERIATAQREIEKEEEKSRTCLKYEGIVRYRLMPELEYKISKRNL